MAMLVADTAALDAVLNEVECATQRNIKIIQNLQRNSQLIIKRGCCFDGKYNFAKFLFCLTLLGTELDLVGFYMNFKAIAQMCEPTDSNAHPCNEGDKMAQSILSSLSSAFLASFIIILVLVTDWKGFVVGFNTYFTELCDNCDVTDIVQKLMERKQSVFDDQFLIDLNAEMHPLWPHGGKVMPYHYVPLLRQIVVVKCSIYPSDVDGIFKVNGLSSFTLGFVTLMLVLYESFAKGWNNLPNELYLSIGAFILNWVITFAYYSTPVPKWMGSAVTAVNLCNHFQGLMNYWESLCAKEVSCFMLEECDDISQKKAAMKIKLIHLMVSKFFGETCPREQRERACTALANVPDMVVKDYIVIVRNQLLSSISMPGSLS